MEQIALLGHLTLHCKIVLISVSLRLDHCIVINRWSSRSSYLKKKKKSIEASNSQTSKGSSDNLHQSLFEIDPGILQLFVTDILCKFQ